MLYALAEVDTPPGEVQLAGAQWTPLFLQVLPLWRKQGVCISDF